MVRREGVWAVLKEALTGGDRDLTSIGMRRAVVLLSIPMVLEMAMESLFALVDVFFVSRLGVAAVAVVGLTEGLMAIIYSIAWGLGAGITAVVARRTGEKDREGADVAAVQGILIAIALGLLFAVPGVFFAGELLRAMGASPEVQELGTPFIRIMVGSNVVILLVFGINAIFRGAGNAALAMRSLWIGNIINMVLDPLLIFGIWLFPEMGVTGAAVATVIGRGCAVLYQCWHLFNGRSRVMIATRHLKFAWDALWNIIRVSSGAAAQFLIASASWVFLVRIVAGFGSDAVAGYTISVRIIIFALLPAWGVANAASTLVGQNLGALQPDRAEQSAWLCGHYNMVYMSIMAMLFIAFAPWMVGLFSPGAEALHVGVQALRVICLGYFFYAYGMVLSQSFNGAGDPMTPVWLNMFCFWLVEIPLAWSLARWLGGPEGVFIAIAFSESLLALLCIYFFRKGKWKLAQV